MHYPSLSDISRSDLWIGKWVTQLKYTIENISDAFTQELAILLLVGDSFAQVFRFLFFYEGYKSFFVCPSPWVTLLSDIQWKALEPNSFTKICIMCKLLTNFTPKNQVNFDFDRDHDLMATDSRISEVTVGKCTLGQSMFDSYFNQGPSLIISYPSFGFHCILIFIIINENLLKFRCRETFARWDRLICNFDLTNKILNFFRTFNVSQMRIICLSRA